MSPLKSVILVNIVGLAKYMYLDYAWWQKLCSSFSLLVMLCDHCIRRFACMCSQSRSEPSLASTYERSIQMLMKCEPRTLTGLTCLLDIWCDDVIGDRPPGTAVAVILFLPCSVTAHKHWEAAYNPEADKVSFSWAVMKIRVHKTCSHPLRSTVRGTLVLFCTNLRAHYLFVFRAESGLADKRSNILFEQEFFESILIYLIWKWSG